MTTVGVRTVEEVARAIGTSPATALHLLEELVAGGIVERHREGWRLRPDLHPELLAALRTLSEWAP